MTNVTRRSGNESPVSEEPDPASCGLRRLLVFHLAHQAFAIPLTEVQQVVPMALLSCPPGLPSVLAGFLNLAGEPVPVLRLARLFELPDRPAGLYTPLVIVRDPDGRIALIVEGVTGILSVPEADVLPVDGDHLFNGCAEAQVASNGRIIHLLSVGRILLEKERHRLAELRAMEQKRLREWEETKA